MQTVMIFRDSRDNLDSRGRRDNLDSRGRRDNLDSRGRRDNLDSRDNLDHRGSAAPRWGLARTDHASTPEGPSLP